MNKYLAYIAIMSLISLELFYALTQYKDIQAEARGSSEVQRIYRGTGEVGELR